jgi:hypothetical protein
VHPNEWLRAQHGLITRAQALGGGATRRQIERLVRTGEWMVVVRGVYRHAAFPVTFEQKALAAVLATSGVGSHGTAGVLHEVHGVRPGRIEVSVAAGRWSGTPIARMHQARHLGPFDISRVAGVPVTSVARTLADLAPRLPYDTLCRALDLTVTRRQCTVEQVRAAVDRAELRPSRDGSAALRRALEAWTPGPLPGSVMEMAVVRRLLAWGFGHPVRQFYVSGVGFVDLAYPPQKVSLEYDSDEWHDDPRSRRRDRARSNDLVAAGWHPFIVTADDLRPRATRLRRALAVYL